MRIAEAEHAGLEHKCRPQRRRACLQAKAYPEELLQWRLGLQPRCDGIDCPPGSIDPELLELLDERLERGGAQHVYDDGLHSIVLRLSYDDVLAVARLESVSSIGVECGDTAFCSCADLLPERCAEHAFCRPILGWAISERCVSTREQAVGCSAAEVCGAAITDVVAPNGGVWRLHDTCMPSAPGWTVHPRSMLERPPCKGG
ncbi:MAG: hypothetical protein IAG13_26115 [Deltaproteobacteria bacterium]|nr:hypothetical protein [Nannocystaceae bacterium]